MIEEMGVYYRYKNKAEALGGLHTDITDYIDALEEEIRQMFMEGLNGTIK